MSENIFVKKIRFLFCNGNGVIVFFFFRYVKSKIASKWCLTVVFQSVIVIALLLQAQLRYLSIDFQRLQTLIKMKLEKVTYDKNGSPAFQEKIRCQMIIPVSVPFTSEKVIIEF